MTESITNNILQNLYNRKINKGNLVSSLKQLDYKEARKVIRKVRSNPFAKSILESSPLPKAIDQLRKHPLYMFSNNLEGELAWIVESILSHSKQINIFISKEKEFEAAILLNDLNNAENILDSINKSVCVSYWGYENLFSLIQAKHGNEKNWELLAELNSKTNINFTLYFNEIFSKKADRDISILQYQRSLENEVRLLEYNLSKYLVFKLGYFLNSEYEIESLSFALFVESNSSIIDRYTILLAVLAELIASEDYYKIAIEILFDLDKVITDTRIKRLLDISGKGEPIINTEVFSMFDQYASGNYSYCLDRIPKYIETHPTYLELYELYIKCLLESSIEFSPLNISETVDFILQNFFNLITKNNEYESSQENLLKFYISYPNLKFSKQLLGNIGLIGGVRSQRNMYAHNFIIYSNIYNSYTFYLLKNKEEYTIPQSILTYKNVQINYSINFNKSLYSNDTSIISKNDFYDARRFFMNKNFEECINVTELLINRYAYNPIIQEECIYMLFNAYTQVNNLDAAVQLCVDSYFTNNRYLIRLNIDSLVNDIINSEYEITKMIDLPILFYLSGRTNYYQYVALEEYLVTKDIELPSQLIEQDPKTIFVLRHVCKVEVLEQFYLVFDEYSEVIGERKDILKRLIHIDKDNVNSYFEEIATLTQNEKIKSIISKVNDGKISLNFSKIFAKKENSLETSFSRFLRLKEFSKTIDLKLVDSSEILKGYLEELSNDTKQLHEAPFLTFKSIINEIIGNFLFSKEYGLDGDISTRIRHGVLENQIRSVFVKNHIISKRNHDQTYENIDYWEKLGIDHNYRPDVIIKVQDKLKDFSKEVDSLIQSIVNDQIQVVSNKYPSKENALFNYKFTDDFMWIMYRDVSETIISYTTFLEYMLNIIEGHTEVILKKIRHYLVSEVNEQFQEYLNVLKNEIKDAAGHTIISSEISEKIINSKTQISYELENVAGWFKLSKSQFDETLDLETIIHTSVQLINFSNPSNNINPKVVCEDDSLYIFYSSFIDIFTILLDNIIRHSYLQSKDTDIEIIVTVDKNIKTEEGKSTAYNNLKITIKNKINCDIVDINNLNEKFKEIKTEWHRTEPNNANIEGGSGYQKIKRILNYELGSFGNKFDYAVTNDVVEVYLSMLSISSNIDYE